MTPKLTVIHLARKPLSGTVAQNTLKYGTGGLNIDACRIGTEDSLGGGAYAENGGRTPLPGDPRSGAALGMFAPGKTVKPKSLLRTQNRQDNGGSMNPGEWKGGTTGSTNGRWPANLILSHIGGPEGCRQVGVKKVPATSIHGESTAVRRSGVHSDAGGHQVVGRVQPVRGYADADGLEEVADWQCAEGCPCLDLDRQTGILSSGQVSPGQMRHSAQGYQGNFKPIPLTGFGDEGGASRYFKQVQSEAELHEYLKVLISPPPTPTSPHAQVWPCWPWAGADNPGSQVGLIIHGFVPTQEETAILYSTLVPGGHLCLVAPDDQPTGHTGAIRLEDAGFEIRDAILWVRGPGRLHYVAKAARKEREAGCSKLPAKKGFEAVDREEGSAGVANPRAGAGRTAGKVHNFHPTVKPIEVMARLLVDVPTNQGPVLDPFQGSGTTMVACLQTGHSGVGIERDPEYLAIAEARVKYGNRWAHAEINVAAPEQTEVQEESDPYGLLF